MMKSGHLNTNANTITTEEKEEQPLSLVTSILLGFNGALLYFIPAVDNVSNVPGGSALGWLVAFTTGTVNTAFNTDCMARKAEGTAWELTTAITFGLLSSLPPFVTILKNPVIPSSAILNITIDAYLSVFTLLKNFMIYGQEMPPFFYAMHEKRHPEYQTTKNIILQKKFIDLLERCKLTLLSSTQNETTKQQIRQLINRPIQDTEEGEEKENHLSPEQLLQYTEDQAIIPTKEQLRIAYLGSETMAIGYYRLLTATVWGTLSIPCLYLTHSQALEADIFSPIDPFNIIATVAYAAIFLTLGTMAVITLNNIRNSVDEALLMGVQQRQSTTPPIVNCLLTLLVVFTCFSFGGMLPILNDAPADLEKWDSLWNILYNLIPWVDRQISTGSDTLTFSFLITCIGVIVFNAYGAVFQMIPLVNETCLKESIEENKTREDVDENNLTEHLLDDGDDENQPTKQSLYMINQLKENAQHAIQTYRRGESRVFDISDVVKPEMLIKKMCPG